MLSSLLAFSRLAALRKKYGRNSEIQSKNPAIVVLEAVENTV